MTTEQDVLYMKCEVLRDVAQELIQALDNLDELDYFGTEGWRHMLLKE